MLRANAITKRFGARARALDAASFDAPDGEVCVLLGHNGAGKTTAMHCFVDLVRPDAGTAEVDGLVVASAPVAARRNVSYLGEQVALYPALTGRENVRFFAGLCGHRATRDDAAVALERWGLASGAIDRPVQTYSKGMRQRVGLAIAAIAHTRNLILDEPTSGLDPSAAQDLMSALHTLARDGTAVIVSSHDLTHAARVADSLVCLSAGRVVAVHRGAIDVDALVQWFSRAGDEALAA